MAKITVLESIMGSNGIFYCAGWVGEEYIHFLADYKMTKKEIKNKLKEIYNKNNVMGLEM